MARDLLQQAYFGEVAADDRQAVEGNRRPARGRSYSQVKVLFQLQILQVFQKLWMK